MTSQRLSGTLLLIGSVLFLIAAFMPSSVFAQPDIEEKLAIINFARSSWKLQQVLFGSGAVVAAIGFFVAYLFLRARTRTPQL